ncbi:alpha-L-glutamate ligase-like protein [Aeromonas simiae]|uniref:Alpha-L-glutamate ligase-like protein n=1 Tax=Aeromonas simiae TaxID=218936 RepID=A0A5J6X0W1_9GAMM|nr:alpha-L-glutamate ligase-like protein [Aeromonas simiae]MDO2946898.1 alpha-L-glutamate ligase-like protein [Aeromonas simiae]MDO2951301.1 alpha-L-glutamate ligase-like protein [Aeromonas simiae]MDO2954508.1 alpha-L-glutamate ligase-like protein [Aeromonas simiae]QFI55245.1 alpha-L-glutamate ligase-like protein [Aeromonas simiae]
MWPWEKYTWPWKLSECGILGMNKRNHSYISRYNPRSLYPLVDDKLKTKRISLDAGVTVPDLIGTITEQHAVSQIAQMVEAWPGFCIKPARGSGGKGILVILRHEDGLYYKPNGSAATAQDLERHVSNILAGLYSLGGKPDKVLVENLINFDDVFDGYSFEGVPDTRVIIFKGFPVMAMMRLSTAASDGKANLHQGAVGVGLCLRTGRALRAVQFNQPIRHHPDTGLDLFELKVPHWDTLLTLAASCYEMSGLGYIGTDMVLDKQRGPMLLELNARPGLAIQIANGRGLVPNLKAVEKLGNTKMTVPQRIAFAKEHFGVFDDE